MNLKQKLKAKQPTLGTWITVYHRSLVEIVCNAKFDWVCVDLEHSSITIDQAATLIALCRGRSVPALVRLSSNDSVQIKRVMDAGAEGVIVPMVKNRDEVLHAFKAMHYPPEGFRGVGLSTAQDYGASFETYKKWQKDSAVLIVQVEHIDAVNNFEEIMGVDGVDGYIIGPYDLSASMGIPGDFQNPMFLEVKARLDGLVKKTPKASGIHIVEPSFEALEETLSKGYSFVAISFETRILDVFFRKCRSIFESQR